MNRMQAQSKPPIFTEVADCSVIAGFFRDAGYTEEGVQQRLKFGGLTAPSKKLPLMLRYTREGTLLDKLIRLFFLGVPLSIDAVQQMSLQPSREFWEKTNLIEVRGGKVFPLVKLTACWDLLLASDLPDEVRQGAHADFVMGPANSSVLVAKMMMQGPFERILDIGTGCGVLALLASRFGKRVFATDKNERALAFTRFNALLNGINNVECLQGSLFEPVEERNFDLIISSPPYVISPSSDFLFCDSGWRGDEFSKLLLQEAGSHLRLGGYCQIICNWGHQVDQNWREGLEGWFEGIGCDAIIWGGDTQDVAQYAITWIQDTRARNQQILESEFDRWMDYFAQQKIEAISYGVIAIRRREGSNWIRMEDTPSRYSEATGDDIQRRFLLQDYINEADDSKLLGEAFCVVEDVHLKQELNPTDERMEFVEARLQRTRGLIQYCTIDANIAGLITRCNTRRSLGDILQEMASSMNIHLEQLTPMAIETIRYLVRSGFLQPASLRKQ